MSQVQNVMYLHATKQSGLSSHPINKKNCDKTGQKEIENYDR